MNSASTGCQWYHIRQYQCKLSWNRKKGERFARWLYPCCHSSPATTPCDEYALVFSDSSMAAYKNESRVAEYAPGMEGDLFAFLEYTVSQSALKTIEHTCTFHSGAVAVGSKALLMPADSGSGKTTLTVAMTLQGADCLGDDLNTIYLDSGEVQAFERSFLLKGETAQWYRSNHTLPEDLFHSSSGAWYVPRGVIGNTAKKARLHTIVFPRYDADCEMTLHPVGQMEALEQISRQISIHPKEFGAFVRVFRNSRIYRFTYNERMAAAKFLLSTLQPD